MKTLVEEFKGNIPNIEIKSEDGKFFDFECVKTGQGLVSACTITRGIARFDLSECYECLGYNRDFARFYRVNARCSLCGERVDFGYFIFVYLLEKADLLPKKFKMRCCICDIEERKIKNKNVMMEGVIEDGEEREG